MNFDTHEVNRLAAQMADEGATSEEIQHAVNEYLMGCDLEHPEVQRALFYGDYGHNPTLTEYAQMSDKERLKCNNVWNARRLNITTDFYTLTA